MAKSRTPASRRGDAEHQRQDDSFDAGTVLDISASASTLNGIANAMPNTMDGEEAQARGPSDATASPVTDSPSAVMIQTPASSPKLVHSVVGATPAAAALPSPPSSPHTPPSASPLAAAFDSTKPSCSPRPSAPSTSSPTLATNTTPTPLAPATSIPSASFNTDIDTNTTTTTTTNTENQANPDPHSPPYTPAANTDIPPPIMSSTYPFSAAGAATGSSSSPIANGTALPHHHHPLQMHTRVNSSAEDWTPETHNNPRSMHAVGVDAMRSDANKAMAMDLESTAGEGYAEAEKTLVEDRRVNGAHRKGESSGSVSRGTGHGGKPSAGKGHTPKGVSQSSSMVGERWDPLHRPQDSSDAGHDRDRTLLGDETTLSTSRKPSEANGTLDVDEDLDEQDLGVSLEKHLHANSTGKRGTHANEHRNAEVPPMHGGHGHASKRGSHLKLDIHPPSPPPWETVDPPLDNNATAVGTGGDYYSPTASKFRTLQSSGPRTLIPKSSYYFGPPPPDSAYGTPPTGHIGVHHPREILRIERDYSCGEIIQFAPIYPLELEGRITPTHFLESINSINELLISAHSTKRAMLDNMLAIFSLQISKLFIKSHFEREMLRLRKLIDELNATLYNPVGLNILYPRDVAFLYVRTLLLTPLIEEKVV